MKSALLTPAPASGTLFPLLSYDLGPLLSLNLHFIFTYTHSYIYLFALALICWVFIAAQAFHPVCQLLLLGLPCLRAQRSRATPGSCSMELIRPGHLGLVALQHVESPRPRDQDPRRPRTAGGFSSTVPLGCSIFTPEAPLGPGPRLCWELGTSARWAGLLVPLQRWEQRKGRPCSGVLGRQCSGV